MNKLYTKAKVQISKKKTNFEKEKSCSRMKNIFLSIFSKSISKCDFERFWANLVHSCLAHHLKIQIQIEINGKIFQKLHPISKLDFDFDFSNISSSTKKEELFGWLKKSLDQAEVEIMKI